MEHHVKQRTAPWYELRRKAVVTASRFGDAVGVGKGKPFDFLCSLLSEEAEADTGSHFTQHGIDMEPVVHEAYDLLTGYTTRESGYWTFDDVGNPFKNLIGASPDAIVIDPVTEQPLGLCEFKAPVYRLYKEIPQSYMAQVQGQMAVTGLPWCDFMALCKSTREIMLKRVYFCQEYWDFVSTRLLQFCFAFQEMKRGRPCRFVEAVKRWDVLNKLDCCQHFKISEILKVSIYGFTGPSGVTMNFDLLTGCGVKQEKVGGKTVDYSEEIRKLDESIDDQLMDKEIVRIGY